jgi:hypothetical protein
VLAREDRLFYEHEFRVDLGKYSIAEKDFPETGKWPFPSSRAFAGHDNRR